MKIVADENIPLLEPFFGPLGEVLRVPGRQLDARCLEDAEILLVRSVTRVDRALLQGTPVRFVASATIGTDHVDLEYLREAGIGFANAPGCNAESVVDYVLSALVNLALETGTSLRRRSIGIVGAGNVGARLQQRLQSLGCQVLVNDPPRAAREGAEGFCSLARLLEACDVLCLHTPLTREGSHPSFHLLHAGNLPDLRPGTWLINAGRGGAVDNRALSELLTRRSDLKVVLDVWENEPAVDPELALQVHWGTPHIAGYSLEGRSRGTAMIYASLCRFLGRSPEISLDSLLPPPAVDSLTLAGADPDILPKLVNLVYDLRTDHLIMRRMIDDSADDETARGKGFDRLRREYPPRREFSSLNLRLGSQPHPDTVEQLSAAGFRLDP